MSRFLFFPLFSFNFWSPNCYGLYCRSFSYYISVISFSFTTKTDFLLRYGKSFVPWLYLSVYPFPNKPWSGVQFFCVTSNFSFSHSVFYWFGELFVIFITFENVVCKLFEFGRVQNLSFGKGLNLMGYDDQTPSMCSYMRNAHIRYISSPEINRFTIPKILKLHFKNKANPIHNFQSIFFP